MQYTALAAHITAREWGKSEEDIEQWREKGIIPDELALHKNNTTPNRVLVLSQLLALCGAGYLKAEIICQQMGWYKTRISDVLTHLRNQETTTHRTLYGEEIDRVAKEVLRPLRTDLQALLVLYNPAAVDTYPANLQELLRNTVATHAVLNPARLTVGRPDNERRMARKFFSGDQEIITAKFRHLLSGIFTGLEKVVSVLDGDLDALSDNATTSAPTGNNAP
ncbi:hypothetical protein CLV58_12515 [Spirosoma oryzae]|uniref:Uncharacterized protein n=1 Tax=Spirosoma oryzae TaxID=1469603 RepID=A0A2T0S8W6_9BACT|nr:hypothetical protein [Spirosoma oryzae]PRY29753.1 hypothetical protein CLV58_12515 [Spirosoma oryzae]